VSLEIRELSFSYGEADILKNASFSARDGDLVAVLGPNGAGKSTLFRCILGFLKPKSGKIQINGKDAGSLSRPELAREIAYIPQISPPTFNYTVLDTVLMGLSNRIGLFSSPTAEHRALAMDALDSLGIGHLGGRGCAMISGGEKQLMLLARALVQNAGVLVMDEPTANLDYGNSFRVMERIESLSKRGYTVIFSTHDPNQAFRHATRVLVLKKGGILAEGPPGQALTEDTLSELYGVGVAVRKVEAGGVSVPVSLPFKI
jgi:iron complex transport system ATP-binding protein